MEKENAVALVDASAHFIAGWVSGLWNFNKEIVAQIQEMQKQINGDRIMLNVLKNNWDNTQPTFTCSKLTMIATKQCMKSVQSWQ